MIQWPEKAKLIENKYSKWYSALITKAQLRVLPKALYTEGHHVIPKSWGGSDNKDNIVRLTAKEHYMAHALLWKMNVGEGYHNKMVHAFNAMSIMKDGSYNKPGYRINSRLFESVRLERIAYLKTLKGPLSPAWGKPSNVSPEVRERITAAVKERWADPEFKSKMIEKRRAFLDSPEGIKQREALAKRMTGFKKSPEAIEKTAAAKRGKTWEEMYTPEQIQRMSEAGKNKTYTPEGKQRQIESSRRVGQRPKSENFKRLVGLRFKGRTDMIGEKNPNYGKKWTDEMKKAASERLKGKILAPEVLEKRRQKMAEKPKFVCAHCNKVVANMANYNRWHGDNCKKLKQ